MTDSDTAVRVAAQAFLQSYAEHLNHHCKACTEAYDNLRDALEPTAQKDEEVKIEKEFRVSMGERRDHDPNR